MKSFLLAILFVCVSLAQTLTPPVPVATAATTAPPNNVDTTALPSYMVGTGVSWNRYAAQPYSNVTSFAVRIGATNVYSWSTIDTPIAATPAGGSPLPSSVRTGAAYVAAQSSSGRVFLVLLGDLGLTSTPSAAAAGYSAGLAVAWRPVKAWPVYVMPLYRLMGASNAGAYTVPEIQVWYSFGGK
jgi:hypothetical protein